MKAIKKRDTIIIGMGISALCTAARLLELGKKDIAVYAISYGASPNAFIINFVLPNNIYNDTPEEYFKDIIYTGYGINNKTIVKDITESSSKGYEFLKRCGVDFGQRDSQNLKLCRTYGHKYPRSLINSEKPIGKEIVHKIESLLKNNNVEINLNCECVNIISEKNVVYGAVIKSDQYGIFNAYANNVVAAWGGSGNIIGRSTYPHDIKGNTISIAHSAGAELIDIEFLEYDNLAIHSSSGGIYVDKNYESSIKGFFAVGEACGGFHGAKIGHGNCLSQAVVSGILCAESITKIERNNKERVFEIDYKQNNNIFEQYAPKIKKIASDALGFYRSGETLAESYEALCDIADSEKISNDTHTRQIADSARLIIKSALERRESRGLHSRVDFPDISEEFSSSIII